MVAKEQKTSPGREDLAKPRTAVFVVVVILGGCVVITKGEPYILMITLVT